MAFFDVIAAKKEGWTDSDIASFLSQHYNWDINAAKKEGWTDKEVIQFLNKTGASAFDTFLTSARQEVGSEITGIRQLLGQEPTDTAEESLRRQMESENPIAGFAGTLVGGLVNPSTLLPGSFLFKGAKGVAAAGAAAGGVSGLLQPRYEEEDLSRLASGAFGAALGGTLGGAIGALTARFGKKATDDLVQEAIAGGAKTEKEIVDSIQAKTGINVKTEEDLAVTLNEALPENKAKITPETTADQVNPTNVAKTDDIVQFKDLFNTMDSAVPDSSRFARDDFAKGMETGDFTDFINRIKPFTTEYEFGQIPLFKIRNILDEGNQFRDKNLAALRELNIEKNIDGIRLLQARADDINNLRAPDPATPPTPSEAVQAYLGRDIGEIFDLRFQNAALEWLNKELATFENLDTFYRELIQSGVPEREAQILVRDSANQFLNVTAQVFGNRAQAARLLGDKGTVKTFGSLRNLMKMIERNDARAIGEDEVVDLIDSIAKIKAAGANGSINTQQALGTLARKTQKEPTLGQKFSEAITNIYTSGIQTAVVNAMSPPVKMLLNGIESAILTLVPGSPRFLEFRRAGASLNGLVDAFRESLFFAKTGFLRGQALDNLGDVQGAIGKQKGASQAEKILGETIRTIGTRPSVGIDEFFKTYFRKMELYDQYYKLAYSGRFKGKERQVFDALKKIDTSDLKWSENIMKAQIPGIDADTDLRKIVESAREYAKLNTFQADLGKLGNDLLRLKSNNPAAALIIPFVKTPINILKDGISYTPLGLIPGFTPTRGVRDASGRLKYDSKGNPIREAYLSRDQRLARAAMGMAGAVTLAMHVGNNEITGSYPKDPGKRAVMMAAGIPEYSIKVGDQWIPYGRVEPLATTLGFIADNIRNIQEMYQKNPKDRKIEELASQTTVALANNLANKTFLQGIAGVIQAINEPERHGSAFIKGFASLAVPGAVAQFAKAEDENVRITDTFAEAVKNRLPGMREELPIRYNLFGGAAENPVQGVAAFTGFPIRSAEQTRLQEAVLDAGVDYSPPRKSIKGVDLDSAQQSRYQELSSNMITMKLNGLVNSQGFENLPRTLRKKLIEKQMKEGREIATKIMTAELSRDPEFLREMTRQRILKRTGIDVEEQ